MNLVKVFPVRGDINLAPISELRKKAKVSEKNWFNKKVEDEVLRQQIKDACGHQSASRINYTRCLGTVAQHTDDSDLSSRFIVISTTEKAALTIQTDDEAEIVKIEPGYVYQFNDFCLHALVSGDSDENKNNPGYVELFTVDMG
ncbi:MAG: hypothetical protein GJ680_10485 [Alteromonadaceae bacterium]|nr:hypothetical protein [Alteromonadaceae bacterium]